MKFFYLELKNRLIILLTFFVYNFIVLYFCKEFLLFFTIKIIYYNNLNNYYLIFTDVTEIFYVYLKIINVLLLYCLAYFGAIHFLNFLSSALYKKEGYNFSFLLKLSIFYFSISFFFSYFYVVPITWSFFLNFQDCLSCKYSNSFYFEVKLTEYVDFCLNIYLYSFLYFQMLAVINFFYKTLNFVFTVKRRKFFYYFLFVSTICLSSSDLIFNQSLGYFIIVFFFEFMLFFLILKKNLKLNKIESN